MIYGTHTDLTTLLPALAAQIVSSTGMLAERVLVTMEREEQLDLDPIADRWLTIAPARFMADQGIVAGGGGLAGDGDIDVALYSRLETDYTHADIDALTDSTNGILTSWRGILKALQLFTPVDGGGNGLLTEPMRLKSYVVQPRKPKTPWLRITSTWEVRFIQDLS